MTGHTYLLQYDDLLMLMLMWQGNGREGNPRRRHLRGCIVTSYNAPVSDDLTESRDEMQDRPHLDP